MSRTIPREVNIGFVRDIRTGKTHNVLEVCEKKHGVRFVMAQDSETAKERDKYKLRASLLEAQVAELKEQVEQLQSPLIAMACLDDTKANKHLRETGSYCAFDEPAAVFMARRALDKENT